MSDDMVKWGTINGTGLARTVKELEAKAQEVLERSVVEVTKELETLVRMAEIAREKENVKNGNMAS